MRTLLRSKTQVRKTSVLASFFLVVSIVSVVALLIARLYGSSDVSVIVSSENYVPVMLARTSRVIEVNIFHGQRVASNQAMFKIRNTSSGREKWLRSSVSGVFYAASPVHLSQEANGRVIGYIKVNQPENALQLYLDSHHDHDINVGDDIVLKREHAEVYGKVTLMTGQPINGPMQTIGVAFDDDTQTASLMPGTRFSIHLKTQYKCQRSTCG